MNVVVAGTRMRTPAEQTALAVRILKDEHWTDVLNRTIQKLGDRGRTLGPLDMSRNSLREGVTRKARAYTIPVLVDGIAPEFATLCGDRSASVLVDRYAQASGRPMPSPVIATQAKALYFRLGAMFSGTILGWSERSGVAYSDVVTPDCLELHYLSDDPTEPTVIKHKRTRVIDGKTVISVDEYDLTDINAPRFRVMDGDKDITSRILAEEEGGASGWPDAWRYEDGTPYHRIVVGGDPTNPFGTSTLIETTLNVATYYTHFGAAITDAGHPSRHVRGMRLVGADTNAESGEQGVPTGPEVVYVWEDVDPERPGSFHQFGPGFDPKVMGEAVRAYEMQGISSLGLPVDFSQTGGEPTEQERIALEEAIASTFAECRRVDSEVLRRMAAMVNRITGSDFDEGPRGCLYRDEIRQALEIADKKREEEAAKKPAAPATDDQPEENP